MEDAWEFVLLGLIRENNFVWGGGWVGGHKQNSRNEILEDEGFIPLRSLTRAPLPACPGAGEAFCYPQITVNRHQVAILND